MLQVLYCTYFGPNHLGTSLKADLRQDISRVSSFSRCLNAGTYRTFPVPGTCSWKVPLFLVGSVFPYSRGNKEGKKEPLFLAIFEVFFLQFYTYFGGIKARKLGKIIILERKFEIFRF